MSESDPYRLWRQAGGGMPEFSRQRYRDLMVEHGLLVPGTPESLPCGWPYRRVESVPRQAQWWVCPNDPPCPHPGVLHDIEDLEDQRPTCCAEGCDCGKRADVDQAS